MSPDDDGDWRDDPDPDLPDLGPDVPSVDIPSVDTASAESLGAGEDVDSETFRTFWRLVVVMDVALLALAVGPMFVYFRGNWQRGLLLVAFGLTVGLYGVGKYRSYRDGRSAEESATDDETIDDETAGLDADDQKG